MDMKGSLEEAKTLYEKARAARTEKRYSLNDITDIEFDLLKKMDMSQTLHGTNSKKNWYRQRYGQFQEMMKAFDISDELTKIRKSGGGYAFTERNKEFILMLFREYTDKFEHLKRGEVAATDGAYLLEVYAGILDIFFDAKASDGLIETVMLKLWNRLNIPQRNMDAVMESVYDECKRMVKKNVDSVSMGMGVREKLFWQTAFRYAFYDFIYRWDSFYEKMEEIRQEEVLKKAELEAASASQKWEKCAEIEFGLSSEIYSAYTTDLELQQLYAKRNELLGIGKKRRPLIRNVEKEFEECTIKLAKRMKEIELAVIQKHIPEFVFPNGWDELPPVDFEFMSLKELLDTAMEDEKAQREWCPVSTIDDLLARIKKYYP